MKKIILASTSPRRKELAMTMGLDFKIIPSEFKEDIRLKMRPKDMVMTFALGKASYVAKNMKDELVIGVDTIVVYNGKILGKPRDKKDAFRMLSILSGKKHKVYSGIAIIDCATKKTLTDYEITNVYFKKLDKKEIISYINTGEPMDKAGSYGIQDLSSIFIKKIDGCYFNVVGFPINNLYRNLKKFGVDVFEYSRWNKDSTHVMH